MSTLSSGSWSRSPANRRTSVGALFSIFHSTVRIPARTGKIPEIRNYVQGLNRRMPYFPYFLLSDPATESFELYFLSMIDVDETSRFKPQQAIDVLQEIEKAVRAFCHSVAGNADERLGELFSALPVQATTRPGGG